MNIIKQKLTEFSMRLEERIDGTQWSVENPIEDWIGEAFKSIQKETIKKMLVEERVTSSAFVNHRENILFNQCCAIGRENEAKILKDL